MRDRQLLLIERWNLGILGVICEKQLFVDGVGLADIKNNAHAFLLADDARSIFVLCCFPFIYFLSMVWNYCGAGVFGLIISQSLSPCLALPTFLSNYNIP